MLEAISVRHTANEAAIGYRVVETRKRLKPEFASLSQSEVEAAARNGTRDDLIGDCAQVLFAHTGDAMQREPSLVKIA